MDRSFGDDDALEGDLAGNALELDMPARAPAPAPPPSPEPAPPSEPAPVEVAPEPPPSARVVAPASPEPAAIIARYPPPPAKPWETPLYALKVLWRQLELRQDLATLRKRRSPDVPLYERALQVHDHRAFAMGLAIDLVALTVATVLFFMPVILRFARAP